MAYADYGALEGIQTHTVGASLRIPLFDGGRIRSDRAKAFSLMQQERIREKDLKGQGGVAGQAGVGGAGVGATSRLRLPNSSIALAEEELARPARRRYEAGLTNSLEVIEAKTQLGVARYDRTAALYNCASARIDLAQATGTIVKLTF